MSRRQAKHPQKQHTSLWFPKDVHSIPKTPTYNRVAGRWIFGSRVSTGINHLLSRHTNLPGPMLLLWPRRRPGGMPILLLSSIAVTSMAISVEVLSDRKARLLSPLPGSFVLLLLLPAAAAAAEVTAVPALSRLGDDPLRGAVPGRPSMHAVVAPSTLSDGCSWVVSRASVAFVLSALEEAAAATRFHLPDGLTCCHFGFRGSKVCIGGRGKETPRPKVYVACSSTERKSIMPTYRNHRSLRASPWSIFLKARVLHNKKNLTADRRVALKIPRRYIISCPKTVPTASSLRRKRVLNVGPGGECEGPDD